MLEKLKIANARIIILFQELKDCKSQMTDLTNQWYQAIRVSPNESDNEELNTGQEQSSHQH